MTIDLPSLKQAAERADQCREPSITLSEFRASMTPAVILELIRQHGVMKSALEAGVKRHWFNHNAVGMKNICCSTCDSGDAGYPTNTDGHDTDCFVSCARKALEDCK